MGLRPIAARWFEVLTPHDDVARAVEAMARTGHVQLESAHEIDASAEEPPAELDTYHALAKRYAPHWPRPDFEAPMTAVAPGAVITDAVAAIRAWADEAEPLLEERERLEAERSETALLCELGATAESGLEELARMAAAGPQLEAHLLVIERGQPVPELPHFIVREVQTADHVFLCVLSPRSELEALERALASSAARRVDLPREVELDDLRARLATQEERLVRIGRQLAALESARELPARLASVQRASWFFTHVPPLERTRHFALATGWTSDLQMSELRRALDEAHVDALLRLPSSPSEPPMIFRNPRWARPFQVLSKLLGTPSPSEADPSVLLAVLAPVLFGFMFADVGHGALLCVVGLLARRVRHALGMLIPGGVAAVVFGFLFGSVFGREDILPAIWLHPLSAPLRVLGASVLLGAAILTLGLLVAGVQARWRRRLGEWLVSDGALLLVYIGLLAAFAHRAGLLVAAAGAVVHVAAPAIGERGGRAKAALVAAGKLIERVSQLGVNTVSFARVGAFALAHAGLCVALVELERAAGHALGIAVFVLGNAIVLLLEGLVVGIQTTRLVLFEFFARFLRAEGRPFVPLMPPASEEAQPGAPE